MFHWEKVVDQGSYNLVFGWVMQYYG